MIWYIIASLWAVGTFGAGVWFVFDKYIGPETVLGKVLLTCGLLPIWFIAGVCPFFLVQHEQGPTLATLLKSEWQCTAVTQSVQPVTTMVGKVPVTTMQTVTSCVQYNRL